MSCRYTFLLPAYKSPFLDKVLLSIQKQTYEDYHVLISDDCSPENIYEICEPYLQDSRFIYHRNNRNIGSISLVSHWNLLLDMCQSDFLILASDDDVYEPFFLEEVDKLLTSYPNIDLVRTRCRRINDMGECYEEDSYTSEFEDQLRFIYSLFGTDRIHCIGNYVFRTSVLKMNGGFVDFPLAWFSDDATVIVCSNHGVANSKMPLFRFRSSNINISNAQNTNKRNAIKKIEASKQFFIWADSYLNNSFHKDSLCSIEQNLFYKLNIHLKERIYNQINNYTSAINLISLFKLLTWLSKNGIVMGKRQKLFFIIDSLR